MPRAGVKHHPIRVTIAIKIGYCSPSRSWSRRSGRHCEGIDLVVSGVVNAAASDNAGIPSPCAAHHLVCATAGINQIPGIAIVGVQRPSPPLPATHTIKLFVPSVEVTQAEPRPVWLMLQAGTIVGGFVGVTL